MGVFANATTKDIAAKYSENMAFLSIGQEVRFPFHSEKILPELETTTDSITEAYSVLSNPEGRLKYAQFWFIRIGPLDDKAFQYLNCGDIRQALHIWESTDNLGTLQNRILCRLLLGDIETAITTAESMYTVFGGIYMKHILHDSFSPITPKAVARQFINTITEEVAPSEILHYCRKFQWMDYTRSIYANDILSKLDIELRKSEYFDKTNADAQRQAAAQLMENASPLISRLQEILPADDLRYCHIVDKVGLCMLSYCLFYYDKSTDNILKRMEAIRPMADYAQKIVQSDWAVATCKNIYNRIFRKITPPLPAPVPTKKKKHTIDKTTVIKYLLAAAILSTNLFFSIRTGLQHGFWKGALLFVGIYAAYYLIVCSVIFIVSRIKNKQ